MSKNCEIEQFFFFFTKEKGKIQYNKGKESIMRESKKNKNLIIIIIILVAALLATTSYIIYDSLFKNEEVTEEKENQGRDDNQEEVKTRTLTATEQEALLAQIEDYTTTLAGAYPIDDQHPLTNQQALSFALIKLESLGTDFLESELDSVLEKYFGINHPYSHENIECFLGDGPLYIYNSAKREYTFQDIHGHGGYGMYPVEIYYLDGTTDEKNYTVQVNILYANYCGGTCGPTTNYYTTPEDSVNDTNPILGPYEYTHTITNSQYESIKSYLPVTTFTFEKDMDGNYGLKSVTL